MDVTSELIHAQKHNGSFLLRYQIEVSDDLISISSDTYVINLVIKSDIQISEGI